MKTNRIIYLLSLKQQSYDNVRIVGAYKKLSTLKEEIIQWHADRMYYKSKKNKIKRGSFGWGHDVTPEQFLETSKNQFKDILSTAEIEKLYDYKEAISCIDKSYGVTASFYIENLGEVFISKVLLE